MNNIKVFGIYTDWNRPGAKGKFGGVGWYRIINPLEKIEKCIVKGEYELGGAERVKKAQEMKEFGDIWYLKYVDDWNSAMHIITAKRFTGAKLVIDIDDDMFSVHPDNVAYRYHHPGSEKNEALKFFISKADHLVVSTSPLREAMSKFGIPITVIPNCIDTEIWKVRPSRKRFTSLGKDGIKKEHLKKEKLRIGWVSSANHIQDVPIIEEAMKQILEKYDVEFWVIGLPSPELYQLNEKKVKIILGTSGYEAFPAFLKSCQLDISIAPILDDKFNRSKSNIKWMEAAMCGVPTVASKVYPYEHSIDHGKTGYLARTTENWVYYLSKLIEDKDLREKMGRDAKREVIKEYSMVDHLDKYEELFKNLCPEKNQEKK